MFTLQFTCKSGKLYYNRLIDIIFGVPKQNESIDLLRLISIMKRSIEFVTFYQLTLASNLQSKHVKIT